MPSRHTTAPGRAQEPLNKPDVETDVAVRVLLAARRQGATVRTLAKVLGVSKSTSGRMIKGIDAILSQEGQPRPPEYPESEGRPAASSHLGQDDDGGRS
jgi:hypothetical protein